MSKIKELKVKFNRLTNSKKRVAIAKDVIDQLDAKKYFAITGRYFSIENENYDVLTYDSPLQPLIKKVKECQVCAMGAIFASKVNLYNECTLNDIGMYRSNKSLDVVNINHLKLIKNVEEIFSERQLRMIEIAFEGRDFDRNHTVSNKDILKSLSFYKEQVIKHNFNPYLIMRAIMSNIITNKGEFRP